MKLFLIFSCILVCFSCITEKQTFSTQKLYNSTNHTIIIIPFFNGVEIGSKKKMLPPNSVIELEYRFTRGINNVPAIFFDYFKNVDSLHVMFDNQYQITHLLLSTFTSGLKNYASSSTRNLGNVYSYAKEKTEDKKNSRTWEVKYIFTNQDYLDAQ